MFYRPLLCLSLCLWGISLELNAISVQAAEPTTKPNFLIIMADDCTYNDLPVYNGKNAKTPHIDRLAAEGLTFHKAYLSEAMCQPCRSELFTGRFPLGNGSAWNHSASRPGVKSLPQHLRPLGYHVGLAGKVHVKPESVYPFDDVEGFEKNCVRNPTRECKIQGVEKYIRNARAEKQPFCLVIALVEPHAPWVMGDPTPYPPQKIDLPPNLADTLTTRQAFGKYLAEITYMDGQVGQILDMLDRSGAKDETLVLFTSEQGAQFPGCKWTNWDTGLHTALIARWPGHIAAGKSTAAIVQYADVVPTLLDLAGGEPSVAVDGNSFTSVLLGQSSVHRKFAYGIHNNVPEGPCYPIRTVTDGEYRYIRNLTPHEIYIEKHLMGLRDTDRLPYWASWLFESEQSENTYQLIKRYTLRPAEELYHTTTDPYELNNQISNPDLVERHQMLSQELDQWMKTQGDPGIPLDTQQALQAAQKGAHLFFPAE